MPITEIENALISADFATRQYDIYKKLREESPVYWSPTLNQWLVTAFDLVDEVLTNPHMFSSMGAELSHINNLDPAVREENAMLAYHFGVAQLNITDPPDHLRLRRAFGRSFVPRVVANFEGAITASANRLMEAATADDEIVDVVTQLAEPLPVEVVSEVVGVPRSHRVDIPSVTMDQRHFFGATPPDPNRARDFDQNLAKWHGLLTSWIDERRQQPRDDVLTRAAQMIDAGHLTLPEAIATCLHLIIAGNGTTTASIGNTAFLLISHPDQLAEVKEDERLIANCVEESLRFESPLPKDRRTAIETCELGGQIIQAGERVVCVLAAANRDPAHFEDPEKFDIHRSFTPQQQAAFGRGVHFCLGAPVARLETAVAIKSLLTHVPSPRLDPDFRPQWHTVTTHRGMISLPVRSCLTRE